MAEHVFEEYIKSMEDFHRDMRETGLYEEDSSRAAYTLELAEKRMRQLSGIIQELEDRPDELTVKDNLGVTAGDVVEEARETYDSYKQKRDEFILECAENRDNEVILDPLERNEENWENGNGGIGV